MGSGPVLAQRARPQALCCRNESWGCRRRRGRPSSPGECDAVEMVGRQFPRAREAHLRMGGRWPGNDKGSEEDLDRRFTMDPIRRAARSSKAPQPGSAWLRRRRFQKSTLRVLTRRGGRNASDTPANARKTGRLRVRGLRGHRQHHGDRRRRDEGESPAPPQELATLLIRTRMHFRVFAHDALQPFSAKNRKESLAQNAPTCKPDSVPPFASSPSV